jgi:hypothetical protein
VLGNLFVFELEKVSTHEKPALPVTSRIVAGKNNRNLETSDPKNRTGYQALPPLENAGAPNLKPAKTF